MSAEGAHKRQNAVLRRLARAVNYRTDSHVLLAEFDASLEIYGSVVHSMWFGDKVPGRFASEIAYDLNALRSRELIHLIYAEVEADERQPAIGVTTTGMKAVRELKRSWLSKAIEKQPMTRVQVVLLVGCVIGGVIVGLMTGGFFQK